MQDLGTLLRPTRPQADGINDVGQVVGRLISASANLAFIYDGTQMIDLNTILPANSGWQLSEATAINNNGQIVGWGLSQWRGSRHSKCR